MRWPDLFFKSRKPKPVPEIVTVPPRAFVAPEPTKAEAEKNAAAKLEASKAEKEKAESLRALTESGSIRVPPRAVNDSPVAASAPANKPAEVDKSNAKTAVLPAVTRGSSVSLRQLAKLTDDARSLPKPEEATPAPVVESPKPDAEPSAKAPEPSTESTASGPAAVVPAAFPVPVEAGTVLEKTTEKIVGDAPNPFEAKSNQTVEVSSSSEKPATESSDAKQDAPEPDTPPPRDTARVHVGHTTTSAPSTAIEPVIKSDTREKQEFVLANGERILGHVLSETAQTIYLDHGTLGVLTLPRSQIAKQPIEVILINGDRIVGDLIAETPECLYIKHASLGMVTVPHGQRSARVVEAILKDGDRILGEVLAETEDFTVIRSATLGTVAVQHEQVAMLNRKIEQMQLRALPASAPAIADKPKE
jgi:RNase P/RNase MRP subunit p29